MYADPEKYLQSEPENRAMLSGIFQTKKIYKLSNNKLIQDALRDSDGTPSPEDGIGLGWSLLLIFVKKPITISLKKISILIKQTQLHYLQNLYESTFYYLW